MRRPSGRPVRLLLLGAHNALLPFFSPRTSWRIVIIAPDFRTCVPRRTATAKAALRFRSGRGRLLIVWKPKVGVFAPNEPGNRFPGSFVGQICPGSCPRERFISFTPPPDFVNAHNEPPKWRPVRLPNWLRVRMGTPTESPVTTKSRTRRCWPAKNAECFRF
jgi:hypothetical protein